MKYILIVLIQLILCSASDIITTNLTECILPAYPSNGIYEVANVPTARPGQRYPAVMLTVKCRRGYGLSDPTYDAERVFCLNGEWFKTIPQCVRFCKLDPDPSARYTCYIEGQGFQECKRYVSPGTIVDPACNSPIYYTTDVLLHMRCLSGDWNYVAKCKAECGRITPSGRQLIIDGVQAKRGELPWHVGIYRKRTNSIEQICGGTLVSENIVISAAHCFWKDSAKLLPAAGFAVAIGKIYRSWDSPEDVDAQRSDVKEIRIPSLYQGSAANFQEDIAVVILTTQINYTTYIRPVCLNFESLFDSLQLQHGKLGKIAGWGLTSGNGEPSQTLQVIQIPYVSFDICIDIMPPSFREYITGDKLCAGYTNGTSVCKGDSGGGLTFPDKQFGIDHFYLRGIVSTAPIAENKLCNDNSYSTFTKITKHEAFIKESLGAGGKTTCPIYSFQCDDGACVDAGSDCNGIKDCTDGSDESMANCLGILNPMTVSVHAPISFDDTTTEATMILLSDDQPLDYRECGVATDKNPTPWLVIIYMGFDKTYIANMGTLITEKHVITTATDIHFHLQRYPLDSILIQLGEYNVKRSRTRIEYSVARQVVSISYIDIYEGLVTAIAVLKVNRRVLFSDYIRPICLWNSDILLASIHGARGMFAAWANTRDIYSNNIEPIVREFPITWTIAFRYNTKSYECFSTNQTICSRFIDQPIGCLESVGSGLAVKKDGKWQLRGILLSVYALIDNENGGFVQKDNLTNNYGVYMDVAQYKSWVNRVIKD